MKKICTVLSAMLCAACSGFNPDQVPTATDSQIRHIEPPSWWSGMKCPLQLLVNGPEISTYDVTLEGDGGASITGVSKAESANYLFIDLEVDKDACGTYYLVFTKDEDSFKYPYTIEKRENGSAQRESFTTKDLIYLIMPDRFANGDPSNDSTAFTAEGVNRAGASSRHGGDLRGIIDHLDYLQDLGVTAIWTTPVFLDNDGRGSYHGYAAADYYKVDPRFGDNDLYKELIGRSHEKGIKIIMDIVTNHSGTSTHWWSSDLPFNDWIHQFPSYTGSNYAFSALSDPNGSQFDAMHMDSGWFSRGMADMNLDNPYLLQYFKQLAIWWIEWSGLDGFRVDTYPYNEKVPMSQWCKAITDEYPDFNIVGECWTGSQAMISYWQKDNPNKDGFNSNLPSVMDFPLMNAANGVFSPREAGIKSIYEAFSMDFLYHNTDKVMIFTSNHDTKRVGDIVGKNPARYKAMVTMYATARGILQIFSGDEMMFSSADLTKGDGGLRVDFPGGWPDDRWNFFTEEGRAEADCDFDGTPIEKGMRQDVYDYCRKLFRWRREADVIHNGRTMQFIPQRRGGYAYFRYNDTDTVFVFINSSSKDSVTIPWSDYAEIASGLGEGVNVITGEKTTVTDGMEIGPLGTLVVEYKNNKHQ